jgi:hypothetical protein
MSCPSKTAITDAELNQTFSSASKPGILPGTVPSASDRDGNGMLKSTTVKSLVGSLKSSGIVPTPNPQNADLYLKKVDELLKNTQAEYCFYEARYKYSLERLLSAINQGYTNNTGDVQTSIQRYLATTQELNQRLNDFTQIINGITEDMLSATDGLEQQVQAFDSKMKEQQKKLQAQNKIISSGQAVTELNKQMVKFTEQKGKYSNNLLALYSFMNIVALGLLVYVYKSARD